MEIYDISMTIAPGMTVYKNKAEKRPLFRVNEAFSRGGKAYESSLCLDMHTGTHLDAPLHMIEGGGTVDSIDLERFLVNCRVLDLTGVNDKISSKDCAEHAIKAGDFLLFKTRNSSLNAFDPEFVYLDRDGAAYLKEKEVAGVGIDALGIERSQPGHETHKILLGGGIIILEGLRLGDVEAGEYILCAFPLKIQGVEAAPVRAVLLKGLDRLPPVPLI
ncbi:arylformamidase [Acididesulfobacillus acetoxydans]|uniref:Kynurenine formamidase n=1 Tax=Acididesulfobacillus acetoxydans TaxID=1561005 RepID=A0A8S0X443_9FIRM|nr:cyclase family protein [Acididesulfobacillus acetoxydans]CAA7600550.1 arylformamidase [Acididesulfobacillus acetoxydans]CEJ06684.1 Arylformamidase [Acididesulfobacillus acetoxydans]